MPVRVALQALRGAALMLGVVGCSLASDPTPPGSPLLPSPLPTATTSPQPAGPVALAPEDSRCQNDTFEITVPQGWWYVATGPSSCLFIHRQQFGLPGPEPSERVAIEIRVIEGDVGTTSEVMSEERLQIDGRPAVRWELVSRGSEGGVLPPNTRIYEYVVQLGPVSESGPNLVARTLSWFEEYPENREVLDAVMASLRLR